MRHFRDMRRRRCRRGASRLRGGDGGRATAGSDGRGAVLLLTGATGSIGSRLLPLLLERGEDVRCLVRDPRRLGPRRVDVQIALGDLGELADPHTVRQTLRGVDTVVHLAATIRDQPPRRIEELNGLATVRLLQAAERAGVRRFVFFSALDAGAAQRTRFFRAKWVAEQAVESSPLETSVFAPSIVYDHSDPWITLLRRFSFLPVLPVSGEGRAAFQPIWAQDVAECVVAALAGESCGRATSWPGRRRSPTTRCRTWSAASPGARATSSTCRCRVIKASLGGAAHRLRRGRLCDLGGGRADGGGDDQRARYRRRAGPRGRAAKDE